MLSRAASLTDTSRTNSELFSEKLDSQKHSCFSFITEWFAYISASFISLMLAALRSSGPIPQHVAIIMDGNRRYAKKKRLPKSSSGHFEGAKTLDKLLDYGFRLGIRTVTVYAFSIENFKRPQEEVDVLMSLAAEKLNILSRKSALIERNRVRINVLGALHMLPRYVQVAAAEAMKSTQHHENFILNICFPYTSTYEITKSCELAIEYHRETGKTSHFNDLNLFDGFLDTWDSPPLEILVRTSGESRLSEFLLWQTCRRSSTTVEILNVLWPEFKFRHLLQIVLKYQRNHVNASQKSCNVEEFKDIVEWRKVRKTLEINSILSTV